jgi:hypothetical protein
MNDVLACPSSNHRSEGKLDPANPERGPLLIIDGEKDNTVPWAIVKRFV